jgi:hypothetical protein
MNEDYYSVTWDLDSIRKKRNMYLAVFVLSIIGNIGMLALLPDYLFITNFVLAVIFLILFTNVAVEVLGYPVIVMVLICIAILFIPLVSIITIVIIDRKIYDKIRRVEKSKV